MKKKVQSLSGEEVRSIVLQSWLMLEYVDSGNLSAWEYVERMQAAKKSMDQAYKQRMNPLSGDQTDVKEVHIVFGHSAYGSLKNTLEHLKRDNDMVINLPLMFSIGPVRNLDQPEGLRERLDWLYDRIHLDDEEIFTYVQENKQAVEGIRNIPDHIQTTIWVGNNAHEQLGLRFVLQLLNEWNGFVRTVNVSESHMKRSKGYPIHTGEISPDQLGEMIHHALNEPIPFEERERLEKDWLRLSSENSELRIWNEGVFSKTIDYFDTILLQSVRSLHEDAGCVDVIPSARIIGEVIGHSRQVVGDAFIEYRLIQLVLENRLDIKGIPRGMRSFAVKVKEEPERSCW
ncbi:DUF1835 domain-containing protein [Halobacillus litoralis]|uniref:DUF1835 domain-containing protein n=1 Tax=Halobacillus litoralis TaxID=45668 RepID=UPI001CD2899C|nr:DUF1835 domain-containing protein [Halobacillus litoralis]MCA1023727.1 DUF1835 domain-containing protein [Halobacillus litoralis]